MPRPVNDVGSSAQHALHAGPESAYAWARLGAALVLAGIGGVGMWSVIVALPAVQAEFGVARSAAALPYTMKMICFGFGGIVMGRLSDRVGIVMPVVGGAVTLGLGYAVASQAASLWQFALAQGLLVGVAISATFAPLLADTSPWFRAAARGSQVIASGSYWRARCGRPSAALHRPRGGAGLLASPSSGGDHAAAHAGPRRRSPLTDATSATTVSSFGHRGRSGCAAALQTVLIIAGVSCCVAMSMPQVHMRPYSATSVTACTAPRCCR